MEILSTNDFLKNYNSVQEVELKTFILMLLNGKYKGTNKVNHKRAQYRP